MLLRVLRSVPIGGAANGHCLLTPCLGSPLPLSVLPLRRGECSFAFAKHDTKGGRAEACTTCLGAPGPRRAFNSLLKSVYSAQGACFAAQAPLEI
jgi:hypothetical protein